MTKQFLKNSFLEINNNNLNYCLLRNYHDLPEKIGNDIDILVDILDLKYTEEIFLKNAEILKFIFLKKIIRYGYVGLYFYSPDLNEIILIDLFYKLQKRWNSYADVKYILSKRTRYKQFFVINPTHEIYTIALKEILTYNFVREKYLERFSDIRIDEKEFMIVSNGFLKSKNKKDLLLLINSNRIFNSKFKISFKRINLLFLFRNFTLYIWYFIISKVKDFFGQSPIICLIGPDGVGKTTLANSLKKACVKANLYRSATVYHHRFEIIPSLSKLFKGENTLKVNIDPNFGHVNSVHSWIKTMTYILYYSIDFIFGWFVLFKSKLKNEIIIFDRYYFDFFIQNSYTAVSDDIKRAIYYLFIPKPISTIFLYANPHVIVERKKELTIDQHIEQNKKCIYILRKVVKNPIFLNCNGSIDFNKTLIVKLAMKNLGQ